jgi:uncharacterized protein YbbK (DUF523 family)
MTENIPPASRTAACGRKGADAKTMRKKEEETRSPAVLVSRCLLGEPVRFDGASRPLPADVLRRLAAHARLVPVCPEREGGLPTPRPPAEITGGEGADVLAGHARVRTAAGEDVTGAFLRGAQAAVDLARRHGCHLALLKERSPACGCETIHDGTHSGTLRGGAGVAAAALRGAGVKCLPESRVEELLRILKEKKKQ